MRSLALVLLASGCASRGTVATPTQDAARADASGPARLGADTASVDTVAAGLVHSRFVLNDGPFVVHVLDADRAQCWSPRAVKPANAAEGRAGTSELAARLARELGAGRVGGAINADFFLFTPPGVPTGAHVGDGIVITGPGPRPVFATDSSGTPWIGTLSVTGWVKLPDDSIPIDAWNRASATGVAWYDANYGERVDTAAGSLRMNVSYASGGYAGAVDGSGGAHVIAPAGGLLSVARTAPASLRDRLTRVRERTPVSASVRLVPFHPREAVGGFPILVRDSLEVAGLDSAGSATFGPVRHPRTLVGVASGGRRLLLVTIDGRQPGYSVGMTLREAARLALDLGATGAINLDGGGSTAMAVRRDSSGVSRFDVVNRPSDPQGERPVGNALALACQGRR